jgi:hypothetical protein
LTESEIECVIGEFNEGICEGHHAWRETTYNILSSGYYSPKLFTNVNARVGAWNSCQLFFGKKNLPSLTLIPVKDEAPFQQWSLDIIREIHLQLSAQHRWILTATDYFTKWVEAIPTQNATYLVVINFLEENILERFGCPRKIITDNAQDFKSMEMINFCRKYNIFSGHSTAYYPQGNVLAKSSNKSLMTIIKKVLIENKKSWHIHLKYSLWENQIGTNKSICMSPFQLVYGTDIILPINLSLPVMKLWQDANKYPNDVTRRINQIIEVQQNSVEVDDKLQKYQDNMKALLDKKIQRKRVSSKLFSFKMAGYKGRCRETWKI